MVRLKVTTITIGANAELFQFLMVRLKVIGQYAFSNSNFRFQFLMVRLKVCKLIGRNTALTNFNSLWCD